MRAMLMVVLLAGGCVAVEADPDLGLDLNTSEAAATDLVIPLCEDLKCDLINCVTCFTCGDIAPTCTCYWQGVPVAEAMVCNVPGEPTPDPRPGVPPY